MTQRQALRTRVTTWPSIGVHKFFGNSRKTVFVKNTGRPMDTYGHPPLRTTSPRFLRLARTCAEHLEGMNR